MRCPLSVTQSQRYTHVLVICYSSTTGGASGKEPACQCRRYKTQVRLLGQEDPQEEGMATYFSILTWRIPWTTPKPSVSITILVYLGCFTRYHRLGSLNNRNLFLTVLAAGSKRSECRRGQVLVKAFFLTCRLLISVVSLHGGEKEVHSLQLPIKAIIPPWRLHPHKLVLLLLFSH